MCNFHVSSEYLTSESSRDKYITRPKITKYCDAWVGKQRATK